MEAHVAAVPTSWWNAAMVCGRAVGLPRARSGGLAHEDAEEHGVRQDHGAVDARSMSRLKATMTTWEEPRFLGLSAWR